MKRLSLILVFCILFSFISGINAFANEYRVEPRYNNTNMCTYGFTASDGTASAYVSYYGIEGITTEVTVNVLIEKRALLGLVWRDVEEWSVTSTDVDNYLSFSTDAEKGTYRRTFEIVFEGSNGAADIITDTLTSQHT